MNLAMLEERAVLAQNLEISQSGDGRNLRPTHVWRNESEGMELWPSQRHAIQRFIRYGGMDIVDTQVNFREKRTRQQVGHVFPRTLGRDLPKVEKQRAQ